MIVNTLIVIVHGDGQGDLGLLLSDDIVIHECFDLHGRGKTLHGRRAAPAHIDLVAQQLAARLHTVAADIHSWSGNQLRSLILPLPAEAASNLLL